MLGIEALVFFMENEFQKKNRLTNLAFCVIYWTADVFLIPFFIVK